MGRPPENMGSRAESSFLRKNYLFRHPFIDRGMGISRYGSTPCLDLTWMTAPPEIISSTSGSYG
jgi:hypothetical protein